MDADVTVLTSAATIENNSLFAEKCEKLHKNLHLLVSATQKELVILFCKRKATRFSEAVEEQQNDAPRLLED